jgi:hypothetical protein
MFRKTLTALAIIGVIAAARPPAASAQVLAAPTVAQNGLACLGQAQYDAAVAQNPMIALQRVLPRAGFTVAQLVPNSRQCFALFNGKYVWEVWLNTGGGPVRRVIDAVSAQVIQ